MIASRIYGIIFLGGRGGGGEWKVKLKEKKLENVTLKEDVPGAIFPREKPEVSN